MVILACSVLCLYLHFRTDDVFSFCRFLQLFLQLLYCLDVCIVSGQLAFCINKFDLNFLRCTLPRVQWVIAPSAAIVIRVTILVKIAAGQSFSSTQENVPYMSGRSVLLFTVSMWGRWRWSWPTVLSRLISSAKLTTVASVNSDFLTVWNCLWGGWPSSYWRLSLIVVLQSMSQPLTLYVPFPERRIIKCSGVKYVLLANN